MRKLNEFNLLIQINHNQQIKISKNDTIHQVIVKPQIVEDGNFVTQRIEIMNMRLKISKELYNDEVARFIASRYHASTQQVVNCFLVQDGIVAESEVEPIAFHLEENEMEIMRGLSELYKANE